MYAIKEIEQNMGREKNQHSYEDRIIDIDIILLNKECIKSEKMIIPHLKYHSRSFVLHPLSELGDFLDPNVFLSTNQFLK
jgi:2-amino-4-hydroxy-6-hydroxymethyldihydropteridine diphosphokinase